MLALENDHGRIEFGRRVFVLTSKDFGVVDATHATAKGVRQIGENVVYTALDTRQVEIVGFIRAATAEAMRRHKRLLYRVCNPQNEFLLHYDGYSLRCRCEETPRFAPSNLINNERVARFVIDAKCHDPLFFEAAASECRVAFWENNLIWPLVIPHTGFTFADWSESQIETLINEGDVATGLIIRFAARTTAKTPTLTNIETGAFIRINRVFTPGETVVVNTNYGQEGVTSYRDEQAEDIINDLDLRSTLFQAAPGNTRLHYTAERNEQSITVTVNYHQRYLGV